MMTDPYAERLLSAVDSGYILGDRYVSEYDHLTHVFSFEQFCQGVFTHALPSYAHWMLGQGLSVSERQVLLKLQRLIPSLVFANAAVDPKQRLLPHPQAVLELQHVHTVAPLHYQAELYSADEALSPAIYTAGIEQLLQDRLQALRAETKVFIRNASLLQITKLRPVTLSMELRCHQLTQANYPKLGFKGKARFYQEQQCIAEVSVLFELE